MKNLIDFWVEGAQRFGKPLSIQNKGLTKGRITYKGWDVASWVNVEVCESPKRACTNSSQDKGMQTHVSIFGTHKLTNRLPFAIDIKVEIFPQQVQTLDPDASCGFFCPDTTLTHVFLRYIHVLAAKVTNFKADLTMVASGLSRLRWYRIRQC